MKEEIVIGSIAIAAIGAIAKITSSALNEKVCKIYTSSIVDNTIHIYDASLNSCYKKEKIE
jgi:hypothetical protein